MGGFNGYSSPKTGDGHEEGMDKAIQQMLPGGGATQTALLQAMRHSCRILDKFYHLTMLATCNS